ncbi:MAG: amidohydrolase family protein [Oscillospiraceae bacterium]|jgi:8-oxoguanine deaminase|nr:amidohydrolase family protein [Oscillospiraceae bacterium]
MDIIIRNISDLYTFDQERRRERGVDLRIVDGEIREIGHGVSLKGADRVLSGEGKLALPGLINTHHHFYQNVTRNVPLMQKGGLLRWLLFSYGAWSELEEEDVYAAARLSAAELLLTGVTTSMDFMYCFPQGRRSLMDPEFQAVSELGLRFHGFRGCMPMMEGDLPVKLKKVLGIEAKDLMEDPDTILTACADTFSRYHDRSRGAMTRVGVGPTTVPFAMPELLREFQRMAEERDGLLHTHLHPRPDERALCQARFGTTPHRYLEDIGWFGPRLSLAHVTQHTDEEIAILAKYGVSVTHSPSCHMRLGYPVAPVPACVRAGVNVTIGVDGGSSNDSGDMLAELRSTLYVHRIQGVHRDFGPEEWFDAEDVFRMATNNAAKLLRRDDIGSVEIGKMGDIILIDMNQIAYGSAMSDPLGALIYCGCNHRIDTAVVNGRIVVENGELVSASEQEIVREANRVTRKLLEGARRRTGIDYTKALSPELLAQLS